MGDEKGASLSTAQTTFPFSTWQTPSYLPAHCPHAPGSHNIVVLSELPPPGSQGEMNSLFMAVCILDSACQRRNYWGFQRRGMRASLWEPLLLTLFRNDIVS